MTIEKAIELQLKGDSGVAAIVGTRVWQLILPQRPTFPAIRVQLIDEPVSYHLRGENAAYRARVQVDSYAEEAAGGDTYTAAVALAAAVHEALSGERFSIGSPALAVSGVFREDRRVLYEPDELRLVRILQDYTVWFSTMN